MLNQIKFISLIPIILFLGCATGPSEMSYDSALGEWKTKFVTISGSTAVARMTISDESNAIYGYHGGRILFYEVGNGNKWEGYWLEDYAATMRPCSEEKDGSDIWGVVAFQFNDSFTEFTGKWDACGKGEKFRWTGFRS